MYIRRYYRNNRDYGNTYTDEYFEVMVQKYGIERAIQYDNANYEFVFESEEEREDYRQNSYLRVMDNPRFYLDNLERIPTFTTSSPIYDKNINCFSEDGIKVTDVHKLRELHQKPKTL